MIKARQGSTGAAGIGVLTLGVTLVLALSGCAGAGDQDDGGAAELPFDKYAAALFPDVDTEAIARRMTRAEELAAQCMRDLGFEYTPIDYSPSGSATDEADAEWGTLEFAEQYGYGITTDPWGGPAFDQDVEDPNQEYVAAMSESERAAYLSALWGDQSFDPDADPEQFDEYSWQDGGCQGQAQHEVEQTGDSKQDELSAALRDEMASMWEAISTDPRLLDLNSAWSSCMADAGYPGLATVADAQGSIIETSGVIYAGGTLPSDDASADDGSGAADDAAGTDAAPAEGSMDEQLAALTQVEIDTAVADATCQAEVGYDDAEWEVNNDHQQAFVDAHQEDLDALLAAFEGSDG